MATQVSLNSGAVASAGSLSIQSNGTTEAIGISTGQVATLAQNPVLTSGTANGVAYLNGSKVLTTGSALTYNGSQLKISGLVYTNSDTDYLKMVNAADTTYWGRISQSGSDIEFYNRQAGALKFGVSDAEAMRLTSTGLGIGTSSPTHKLAAIDNNTYQARVATATGNYSSGGMVFGGFGADATDPNYYGAVGYDHSSQKAYVKIKAYNNLGSFVVQTATTGGFADSLTLNTDGNLGLGVTPSAWSNTYRTAFQVGGGSLAGLPSSPDLFEISANRYLNSSVSDRYIGNGYATVYQQSLGAHKWYTAPSGTAGNAITFTQAMTLDASGNLLVGTTSAPTGTSGGSGFIAESYNRKTLKLAASTTLAVGVAEFINSNGTVGSIGVSGSSTSYNTSSDYRLKNTITPMTGALAKVAALKPVTYKWKADGSDGEGFIAHELQEVCPHAVTGEKDAVDENGNPEYQGIDTSFLVATLTAAIQEQQAIIDAQASVLKQLQAQLTSVSADVAALKGN